MGCRLRKHSSYPQGTHSLVGKTDIYIYRERDNHKLISEVILEECVKCSGSSEKGELLYREELALEKIQSPQSTQLTSSVELQAWRWDSEERIKWVYFWGLSENAFVLSWLKSWLHLCGHYCAANAWAGFSGPMACPSNLLINFFQVWCKVLGAGTSDWILPFVVVLHVSRTGVGQVHEPSEFTIRIGPVRQHSAYQRKDNWISIDWMLNISFWFR